MSTWKLNGICRGLGAALVVTSVFIAVLPACAGSHSEVFGPITLDTRSSQTINFPTIGDKITTDTVGLAATASSGLPVSFVVHSGSATITGGTNLSFTGAGAVSIVASQAGNIDWQPASDVTNTFTVTKATAGVTLNNLTQTYNGKARIVPATTDPTDLTVAITYNGLSSAPTDGGTYAVTGTVNEVMYQGSATGTLTVNKADQTISFPAISDKSVSDTVQLSATAFSSLPVSFVVHSGSATITGGTNLSFTGAGAVSIVASQAGNENWNAAADVVNSFTVTASDIYLLPAYRFYSQGSMESTYAHFWTINETEKNIVMTWGSWQYEGICWYAMTNMESGSVPLYRLYEPNISRHLYTINATEYISLNASSWNSEGIQCFVYPTNSVSGAIPAYRFYHSENQNHHFTISENEKDTIVANPDWGYNYEGIAFYVFQTNVPSSLRSPAAQAEQKAGQTALVSEYTHVGAGVDGSVFYEEQIAVKHDIRYNSQTGRWYLLRETEESELIPVPGDYSGDWIEDLALYEQATGNWFISFANEAQRDIAFSFLIQWGGPGFTPVPGDFNNDGISDLAVYHEATGTWYITTVDGKILAWGLELDGDVSVE